MAAVFSRPVEAAQAGMRLDVFLAQQPEVGSRTRAKELIDQGRVSIQGRPARAGAFLVAGLAVEFEVPPGAGAEDDGPPPEVTILHEDDAIVVIDKPAGLASHPPERKNFRGHTVASWAKARYGELPTLQGEDRPGIVHRLDRETSGVMLLARTEAAFEALREQWRAHEVEKEYRAIAFGESRFASDWIERAIASDPRHPDRMIVVDEGGRASATYYEVAEQFRGFTHFRCLPRTGRTHQIRVHLTSIGHSLVGDKVYRSRKMQHEALPPGAPEPRRHCLHALRLSVHHPATGTPLTFTAPMPADLEQLLVWLRAQQSSRR